MKVKVTNATHFIRSVKSDRSGPTRQFDAFGQAVGKVCKDYHHAKLQRRSLPQVKVLQKLICELGNKLLLIIITTQ